jgi:hypothetical protein
MAKNNDISELSLADFATMKMAIGETFDKDSYAYLIMEDKPWWKFWRHARIIGTRMLLPGETIHIPKFTQ